jgi:hypothetical protein
MLVAKSCRGVLRRTAPVPSAALKRGKRNPSLLVMARIADALSVPVTKLLSE